MGKPKMTDKMRLDFVKKHGLPIRYCDSWLVMTPKRTFQIRCGFRAAIDFLARETAKYKAAIRAERKGDR